VTGFASTGTGEASTGSGETATVAVFTPTGNESTLTGPVPGTFKTEANALVSVSRLKGHGLTLK